MNGINSDSKSFRRLNPHLYPKDHLEIQLEAVREHYGVSDELALHDEIIKWCVSQWPRVKYIHARTDQKSTIAKGCHDFTLFLPDGRTLCFECKKKDGKWSEDQLGWKKEMELLGHAVHDVRSMQDFFALVNAAS